MANSYGVRISLPSRFGADIPVFPPRLWGIHASAEAFLTVVLGRIPKRDKYKTYFSEKQLDFIFICQINNPPNPLNQRLKNENQF